MSLWVIQKKLTSREKSMLFPLLDTIDCKITLAYLPHFWMKSCIAKLDHIPRIAKKILALKPGLIALEGPLGAGKTTLTKAIAKELGIGDVIVSPTFILHREYPGLDHVDAWRGD